MASFVRRLVSGQKARFKDPILEMELDLVYVTDNIVIMGYPAQGLASLYRNKRADVRKFLDHRHEDLYRVFNFCPKTEKGYDSKYFYDRVSRYPFPDHHVPPLSMIPLFVVDMTEWLESDPDTVAVIHCKAGKGRSGTMTCCYLLSLPYLPSPPQNARNYSEMKKPSTPPNQEPTSDQDSDAARKESARAFIEGTEAGARRKQEGWATQTQNRRGSGGNGESMANKLGRYWENGRMSAEAKRAAAKLEAFGGPDIQPRGSSLQLDRPGMGGEAAREVEELTDKLRAVFDLHTSRRMKPEKPPSPKKVSRSRSKSNVGQSQFGTLHGMTSLGQSRTDLRSGSTNNFSTLRALGASPAGRSCDALHATSSSTSGRWTPAFGSGNASTYTLGGGNFNTMSKASMFGASSLALNQNTEDNSETKKPRMGVSISSQRRWVGYWARILAGKDARQALANPYSTAPRRQIRITRITVDRMTNAPTKSAYGLTEKIIPHADSLSIQLGRYDDLLVDRLESWERGGRRRVKAFGEHDPSLLAGDLDAEEQKQKNYLKQLKRNQQNLRCWNGDKFTKDTRSHINRLGVNIKAEADIARNFDWRDEQPQLNYFAMLGENLKRVQLDEYGNELEESPAQEGLLSPDAAHEMFKKEKKPMSPQCWRYGFVPENKMAKGRNNLACSSNSECFTNADAARRSSSSGEGGYLETKKNHTLGAGPEPRKRLPSFLSQKPSVLLRKPSQASITTPPSSTDYVLPPSDELKVGQILNADREVCIKILIGRSGGKHSKLPDFTAAGWVWMIPSFEDPLTGKAKVGSRTVIRFDKDEIDFRKQPLGIYGIEVEWEWVTPGTEEEEEEEVDSGDAPFFGRGAGVVPRMGNFSFDSDAPQRM